MAEWLAIPIITVGCFIPGRLLISCFLPDGRTFPGGRLAFHFAAFAAGVLMVGWLAFLLAELGLYSLLRLALLWLTLSLLLLWRSRTSPPTQQSPPSTKEDNLPPWLKIPYLNSPIRLESAVLLIWLLAASWLFFRPHEFIIGGADAGVYVNLSAQIAKNGRILIHDPILDNLPSALYPALLRELPPTENASVVASYYALPGFYITDAQTGQITPQFFHLHPLWQTIAYSLGGVRAALLMTGLWALGGSLALFFLVRQWVSRNAAYLALAVITISALQVWFARYPTTELLTQFLLWTGLWTLTLWLKAIKDNKPETARLTNLLALLAGLSLGQVFLTRIDMYFLLAVPAVLFLWLRQNGRWQRRFNWFFLPLALMTLHSIIHALWQSLPYAYNLFAYGLILIRRNWLIPVAAVLAAIAVLALFGRFTHQLEKLTRYRKPILTTVIIGVVLLALYGWFLRPYLGQTSVRPDWFGGAALPRTDHENLLRLGWYLSPIGIALSVAGICLMLWRINRQTAVILTVGLLFSLLYLWRIQANPHQIYASRRYVPVTLPFAIFAGVYLINALSTLDLSRLKQPYPLLLAAALALVWLTATALSARGFISQVDYRGLTSQISDLNERLDPNSILVFNGDSAVTTGDIIGTPLQYLYQHSVYSLRDPALLDQEAFLSAVSQWQQAGHTVYWVGSLEPVNISAETTFTITIESQHLEGVYDRKPVNIVRPNWTLEISELGEIGG